MTHSHDRGAVHPVLIIALLSLLMALLPVAPASAAPPPLPPGVAERARLLESTPPGPEERHEDGAEQDSSVDPDSAAVLLGQARARVAELQGRATGRTTTLLREAGGSLNRAITAITDGQPIRGRENLGAALDELTRAVANLGRAQRSTDTTRQRRDIRNVRFEIVALVGQLVEPLVIRAELANPDGAARTGIRQTFDQALDFWGSGDADGSMGGFNETYNDGANLTVFDADTFEQNIRDTLDGETVGYTYAITTNGTIVAEDGVGQASTAPDAAAPQYADKQVQIASVSKTLTAILILRLMEENGVGVNEAIGGYLPSNWSLGDGMAEITFAQIMTHTSGLKQLANTLPDNSGIGNDYAGLRVLLGLDLTSGVGPYGYAYTNVGFSLLRVLTFGIMGGDPVDHPEFESSTLTASAFAIYLESVYGSIGVPTSCTPSDPDPTLMYLWPLDGTSGSESSDKVLSCGAFGFFISAHQLAGVLAHYRYTENLLSDEQRDLMINGLYGLKAYSGENGTYYGHDGQWNPGMNSCVMMFSINVEAALTINSIGGNYASPCTVVRQAFDDAWIAA